MTRGPTFVAALVVLAVNDHLLKGAGLLPTCVTGKLSDFAGLLAAPMVLCWMVDARRPRAVLACHAAVALGFGALQLPSIAALFNALGIGHVWADPSDLIALPMVGVSLWLVSKQRNAERRERAIVSERRCPGRPSARLLEVCAGAIALFVCAASMQQSPPSRYPFPPAGILPSDLVVRHVGSEDIQISVQRLGDDTQLDCDALLADPVLTLAGAGFTDAQDWTLARGDAVPLWDRRSGAVDRSCYVVRLVSRGVAFYVAWRHDEPPVRDVDIRLDPGEPAEAEALVLATEPHALPRVPEAVTVVRAP